MMETFFGSAAPMWTAGTPISGWTQAPGVSGNQQAGTASFATPVQVPPPTEPIGYGYGMLPPVPVPPTAGALLTAVAIRRGQPAPTSDAEIEDLYYDTLELLAGTAEVEIRCESGRVTLTGNVPHKRQKRDVGEIAWAIPSVADVQNNVTIAPRRRARARTSEGNGPAAGSPRKQG